MVHLLDQGILLQRPADCPSTIYHVMLGCWKQDPSERTPFDRIVKHLTDYRDHLSENGFIAQNRLNDVEDKPTNHDQGLQQDVERIPAHEETPSVNKVPLREKLDCLALPPIVGLVESNIYSSSHGIMANTSTSCVDVNCSNLAQANAHKNPHFLDPPRGLSIHRSGSESNKGTNRKAISNTYNGMVDSLQMTIKNPRFQGRIENQVPFLNKSESILATDANSCKKNILWSSTRNMLALSASQPRLQ